MPSLDVCLHKTGNLLDVVFPETSRLDLSLPPNKTIWLSLLLSFLTIHVCLVLCFCRQVCSLRFVWLCLPSFCTAAASPCHDKLV